MNTPTGARALCPGEVGKRENLFFSDAAKDEGAPTYTKGDVLCLGSHGLISEGDLSLIVLLQPCLARDRNRGGRRERKGASECGGALNLCCYQQMRVRGKKGEREGRRAEVARRARRSHPLRGRSTLSLCECLCCGEQSRETGEAKSLGCKDCPKTDQLLRSQ